MKTITEEYRKEQQLLHENPAYGVSSVRFAPVVADIMKQISPKTLNDYRAGKQRLKESLDGLGVTGFEYQPYDPAFPAYGDAKPADLVCCIDVLEHIEPKLLDNVLKELARITKGLGFFTIHLGKAGRILSDGRNAHLIQKPTSWWLPKLCNYFEINHMQLHQVYGKGFIVTVAPKKSQ